MAIGGVTVVPMGGGSGMSPEQKATNYICDDLAAREALILSPGAKGSQAFVKDASADETVESSWALYSWDGETWTKTAEGENMEIAELLANYYNKSEVDALLEGISGGSISTVAFSYEIDPNIYVPFWGDPDYSVWKAIPLSNSDANNNINGASMTNSQITLPAGTYIVNGIFAMSLVAGSANIRLRNITGSATLIYGPAHAAGTGPVNMQLPGQKIVLTETTVLEFQIYHTGRLDLIYNTADYGRTTRDASIIFEKIG